LVTEKSLILCALSLLARPLLLGVIFMLHGLNRLALTIFGLALVLASALNVQAQKNAVIIAEASTTKKAQNIALDLVLAAASASRIARASLRLQRS
jgi:hypothetical protein